MTPRSDRSSPAATTGLTRADVFIAVALGILLAASAIPRTFQIHPLIYRFDVGGLRTTDVWFDADVPKWVCIAAYRSHLQNNATSEHPLLPVLLYAPTSAVRLAFPIDRFHAAGVAAALWAGLWIAVFYVALRAMGLDRVTGGAFALVAATSSAAIFWAPVPESFAIGAITILLPMMLVLWGRRAWRGDLLPALTSAASLSVTVTNWFTGLAATWLMTRRRRAVQISAIAFSVVSAAWFLQSAAFEDTATFLKVDRAVSEWERMPQASAVQATRVFAIHSIVTPSIMHVTPAKHAMWRLSVQPSPVGSGGAVAPVATVVWLGLLAAGLVQLARRPPSRPFRALLVTTLLVHYAIHLLLGRETFLFAMHFAPLLVMVAACAGLGPHRQWITGAAVALAVMLAVNNMTQFEVAVTKVNELAARIAATGASFDGPVDCADD